MKEINRDQIETTEFLRSMVSYFKFIFSNWQLLLIFLLVGTCYDLITKSIFESGKRFTGNITFHIELDGTGGGGGQLAGLANTFGLGGTAPTGGSLLGMSNFEDIVTSVNVFQNAFMKEVKLPSGKKQLFINYFIDSSDIKTKEWGGNFFQAPSSYGNYVFTKKKIEEFTPFENQVIADVYVKLVEDTELMAREKTSLFDLNATTSNEMLTKIWCETLMETTEEFYVNMKTKKTKQLLEQQQKRLDSLSYLLRSNDRRLARATFDNPMVVDPTGPMKQQQLTRDNTFLTNQYYTQLANVENLNRMIYEQTPLFTILEPVRLPLTQYKKSGISTRINGLLLLLVSIFVISIIRVFKNALKENPVTN
jgi:hypothetical protein